MRQVALAFAFAVTLCIGLLVHLPVAGAAERVQLTVVPSDDAYVSQLEPNRTSNTERLTAGSARGDRKVIYLKFTVPKLPAAAVDVVTRVVLNRDLHHLPGSVELAAVADTRWSEQTLTMNNAPAIGARLSVVSPTRATNRVSLRIRPAVGTGTHAYAVTSAVTNDVARFHSTEYGAAGPKLIVSYSLSGSLPPPPAAGDLSDVWIGAAASEPMAGGGIDYGIGVFNESNADIGPLVYRRSFDPSLPSSFQTSMARDDAANGYKSFVSWKPPNGDFVGAAQGRYDAQVIAWAESVPNTGVYATSFHEPENDMTGPQFVALQRHLYTVVKAANPNIRWGPVYMAYWWDEGTSHYIGDKDAWWPGSDYADFTAVDVYTNDEGRPLETHPEFRGWYDYMLGKGEPMLIAEYGQYVVWPGQQPDPQKLQDRADTIRQDAAWLAEQGTISMWLYWDAMGVDNGDWRLNDAASQQAWREVAQGGRSAETITQGAGQKGGLLPYPL